MKIKVLVLTLFACMMLAGMSFASEILVSINDQLLNHDDMVIYESGKAYGLVSEFTERMGVEVKWLQTAKMAVLMINDDYVSFQMDSNIVLVNNESFEMNGNAFLREGSLYVPLDTLLEKLGATYVWDDVLLHAQISGENLKIDPAEIRKTNYTNEDILWLARIINAETRGGSLDKKIAVANVVLNRVASPRFPNTIYEVIYQRGQFPPAYRSGFATSVPTELSVLAAKRALMGVVVAKDCLFFNNRPFTSKADSFYKLIEGDYFYF